MALRAWHRVVRSFPSSRGPVVTCVCVLRAVYNGTQGREASSQLEAGFPDACGDSALQVGTAEPAADTRGSHTGAILPHHKTPGAGRATTSQRHGSCIIASVQAGGTGGGKREPASVPSQQRGSKQAGTTALTLHPHPQAPASARYRSTGSRAATHPTGHRASPGGKWTQPQPMMAADDPAHRRVRRRCARRHPPATPQPAGGSARCARSPARARALASKVNEHVEPEEPGVAYSLMSESASPRRIDASRRSRIK